MAAAAADAVSKPREFQYPLGHLRNIPKGKLAGDCTLQMIASRSKDSTETALTNNSARCFVELPSRLHIQDSARVSELISKRPGLKLGLPRSRAIVHLREYIFLTGHPFQASQAVHRTTYDSFQAPSQWLCIPPPAKQSSSMQRLSKRSWVFNKKWPVLKQTP